MTIITVDQWYSNIVHYIEGDYWGMVGGTSDSADIVRCTKDQSVLEKYSIDEYETIQFRSGHKVFITNSDGRSCDIVVSKPVAIVCVIGDHPLSYMAWKYEDGAVFIQGEYWALTGMDRSDYAYISSISSANTILETIKLPPCKIYKFSTGHEIYVTNIVSGWTPNCRITVYPLGVKTSTLHVSDLTSRLDPAGNLPQYNRSGVSMQVTLKGSGIGDLKLSWGRDHDEVIRDVTESTITYKYNLPPGTHNICADLLNIE